MFNVWIGTLNVRSDVSSISAGNKGLMCGRDQLKIFYRPQKINIQTHRQGDFYSLVNINITEGTKHNKLLHLKDTSMKNDNFP